MNHLSTSSFNDNMAKIMNKTAPFSSNAVRLSPREWAVMVILLALVLLIIFPLAWKSLEKFDTPTNFRLAQQYRDDYWLFAKWARTVGREYPIIFLGDSVIWGTYVGNDNTLPVQLNNLFGKNKVANLAIDGLHYVALKGLLKYYGSAISDKKVVLHFNPLWLNSRKFDLSDEKEFPIHHPRLLPQWFPRIKSYRQTLEVKAGIIQERYLPYISLVNHLRLCHLDNKNFSQWVVDNPYKNPFAEISLKVGAASKKSSNEVENWKARKLGIQNWRWVTLTDSFQWKYFVKSIKLLQSRDNEVFVMVGPINPYMLTAVSLRRYRTLQSDIATWLEQNHIDYFIVPDMPSHLYADASHPLKEGYNLIAQQMFTDEKFLAWSAK